MEIKLSVYYGDIKKASLNFSKKEITVGRALDCDVIINDPSVSSKHFIILNEKNNLKVKDLGSINGTFVNGEQVIDEKEVFPGDKITFCGYTIEVSFEGEGRVVDGKEEKVGNKTVVIEREDFLSDLKKAAKKEDKKKWILVGSLIGVFFILLITLLLLPSSEKKTKTSPITVDVIDTYFLQLEKHIDKTIADKKSIENAKRFYELGQEKLKLKNLNKEALYSALVYFLKAKKSVEGINPKPPIWDKIIPAINSTKTELKLTLKKLFKDAWLLESDGNKEGARDVYLAIMQTIPDESSRIYITALRRYNLLK
ncbi:hypothetical protein TTHT_0764 [Thermotomaculum hydrothermale]|uniref:FHA domain-containing protein n=1 Tax=Thermotomaculum hydrothermale TaxID=981385 RepID=A0A7R6PLL4_9BACT|nr:FHA domain-containing protein [Thermotomaculum hydrothermale]BBB32332.1 hypothetical protein TTHT_0764 [Thermotomaculum hydrothermale]